MRILLVNNYFRDVGGVERVYFEERALLKSHGHDVIDFSTLHHENKFTPHAKYFVSGLDFHARGNFFKKVSRLFYSDEVASQLQKLIDETHPDVAHIHGIFDVLGPTVLHVLKKNHIKIIFTAHAYKLICPNWKLFAHGAVDEGCKQKPFHDAWNRSIQNSFLKSFGGAFAWWWHSTRGTFKIIDRIISPSQFLIDKHVEFGWPCEKFVHVPNPFDIMRIAPVAHEPAYILFVGRLVPEKGVDILLDAAVRVPHVPFIIIGDGPERERLMQRAPAHVSFVGRKTPAEVGDYMRGAHAVVVPSVWYENDPVAIVESQALCKIVIGAYIGGIPEQVQEGKTGFLFEAGNAEALADVIERVLTLTPEERHFIGARARGMVDIVRNPDLYYESLMDVLGA